MDSLESKLDRLSAEQRREAEDFIDFLIQRAEGIRVTVHCHRTMSPGPEIGRTPLITPDPVTVEEPAVSLPRDNAHGGCTDAVPEAEPQAVVHEIEIDDGLLDYGKFERTVAAPAPLPSSPADAAVQKVKRKLIQKSEQASKNHSLTGWINFQKTALKKSCVGFGRTHSFRLPAKPPPPAPSGHGWREGGCILKKIFPEKKEQ